VHLLQGEILVDMRHAAKLSPFLASMTAKGTQLVLPVNVCVAALCLDTPEMCAALGVMSRFFIRGPGDAHRAGCIMCHAPPTAYHQGYGKLLPSQARKRTMEDTNRLREEDIQDKLLQAGEHYMHDTHASDL
jgi:hypothetical protein